MTMPILATDRHVRLTQMHAHMPRGKWGASGIRHVDAVPPLAPTVVKNANDFVSFESVSDPPAAGERKPHPKRAIFSLANADVDHGDGVAGNAHFPPAHPMPGALMLVPDVVDLAEAAAVISLTASGLASVSTSATDLLIVIGNVVSQDPAAGADVRFGVTVALLISLGVEIPDVVDTAEAAAGVTLVTAGLIVGNTTTANDPVIAVGNVISQDPAAGVFIDGGDPVDLVISLGP